MDPDIAEQGPVEIVEVGPRDLSPHGAALDDWRRFVLGAIESGASRIEVAAFVNPVRVPRLAGAAEAVRSLPRPDGASFVGMVLNARGARRAVDSGVHELNFALPASESFGRRHNGMGVRAALGHLDAVLELSRVAGLPVTVTVGAAFGCPYEGDVPAESVLRLIDEVIALGPHEVALADVAGVARPDEVADLFAAVAELTDVPLRACLHGDDALVAENAHAALDTGVRVFDGCAGGVGPLAAQGAVRPAAATEQLAAIVTGRGMTCGIDADKVAALGREMAKLVVT